jgi:hypothetical protein
MKILGKAIRQPKSHANAPLYGDVRMASAGCELKANGASSAYGPLTSSLGSLGAAGLCALVGRPLPGPDSAYDPKVCTQLFVEAQVAFAEQLRCR